VVVETEKEGKSRLVDGEYKKAFREMKFDVFFSPHI
jgi:hypothetical protein